MRKIPHYRTKNICKRIGFRSRLLQTVIQNGKIRLDDFFVIKNFYNLLSFDMFFYISVHNSDIFLLFPECRRAPLSDFSRNNHHKRKASCNNRSQNRTKHKHHHKNAKNSNR